MIVAIVSLTATENHQLLRLLGGFKHGFGMFHFIYGMSSFPLTNSCFSRWLLHHQPVDNYRGVVWCLTIKDRDTIEELWLIGHYLNGPINLSV